MRHKLIVTVLGVKAVNVGGTVVAFVKMVVLARVTVPQLTAAIVPCTVGDSETVSPPFTMTALAPSVVKPTSRPTRKHNCFCNVSTQMSWVVVAQDLHLFGISNLF